MLFDNADNTIVSLEIEKNAPATIAQIVTIEINEYISAPEYKEMQEAEKYYKNDADIIFQKRKEIDRNGNMSDAHNLADNRLSHDYFATLLDQKLLYLLGKTWSIDCENETYTKKLEEIFNDEFKEKMKRAASDAIGKSCGWLFLYPQGKELKFMRISPLNIKPLWQDADHSILNGIIYFYDQIYYEGLTKKMKKYAQYWDKNGVTMLENKSGTYEILTDRVPMITMVENDEMYSYNWERIPFIPLKYNEQGVSLLHKIKSLIDEYNRQVSLNANRLEDDANKILTVRGYEGQKLGELREKLSLYRMVIIGEDGGLEALDTTIDIENTEKHLDRIRKDIFTFGRGVDPNADFGANASAEARQYQYTLLDMDCNSLEKGCHNLLQNVLWFVNNFYKLPEENVKFVFNRDIITNELSAIEMCVKSQSVQGLSMKTILSNHPWVKDADSEIADWEAKNQDDDFDNDLGTNNIGNDQNDKE